MLFRDGLCQTVVFHRINESPQIKCLTLHIAVRFVLWRFRLPEFYDHAHLQAYVKILLHFLFYISAL